MNDYLEKQVLDSGYIHAPLPIEIEDTLESEVLKKAVIKRTVIWPDENYEVTHSGRGSLRIEGQAGRDGRPSIRMTAAMRYESWPEGETGHYSNYGMLNAHIKLDHENLEDYNRLSLWMKPECDSSGTISIFMAIYNAGRKKLPDLYFREGVCVVNLRNHEWNHIVWEIPSVPRDSVHELTFYTFLTGENGNISGDISYFIDEIEFQTVERPEHVLGWKADYDLISYSTAGYDVHGSRMAVSNIKIPTFTVRRASDDSIVLTGNAVRHADKKGELYSLDFTSLDTPGEYILEQNGYRTPAFGIRQDLYEEILWKTLNFLFCQRCGYPVPEKHGACHTDMVAEHAGLNLIFNGGWHDAGDLSQFAVQSFEITAGLFEISRKLDPSSPLYRRLMEEAQWGLDFVLRTRFGDGYRATSSGCFRYTNGLIGDFDDLEVTVHNHPIDNFISASTLASAAQSLKDLDSGRSAVALKAARADYGFAKDVLAANGFVPPSIPWEHTYPSGEAVFFAIASVAASNLFKVTGDVTYAEDARTFAGEMLRAQEVGQAGLTVKGFFYRDQTRTQPQHFNHQSREHYFMQALVMLCETQPEAANKSAWEEAMALYTGYLKEGMQRVFPYALLPSGVYKLSETEDEKLFKRMSFACEYKNEVENWKEQIKNGDNIGQDYYFRLFPVWHSFRGNAAVQLESGKAAALLGRYFSDDGLVDLGREQIYWLLGKNPFSQSIMYGVGKRFTQLYAILPGETVGALPVGISSYENEDVPYWPQGNNCTYKEVWTSSSRSLLWLMAELMKSKIVNPKS